MKIIVEIRKTIYNLKGRAKGASPLRPETFSIFQQKQEECLYVKLLK